MSVANETLPRHLNILNTQDSQFSKLLNEMKIKRGETSNNSVTLSINTPPNLITKDSCKVFSFVWFGF